MQKEKYKDKTQVEHESHNLAIFVNTTVSESGLSFLNGLTAQNAAKFKKSIRHGKRIVSIFKSHKPHATDGVTIYDNELDKTDGGKVRIQFNSGLTAVQLAQVKNRVEFCKITNIQKSYKSDAKGKVQPQQVTIIGEQDFANFTTLVADAAKYHKKVTEVTSAEYQNNITVLDLIKRITDEAAAAAAAPTPPPAKKNSKRKTTPIPAVPPKKRYHIPDESESNDEAEVEVVEEDVPYSE